MTQHPVVVQRQHDRNARVRQVTRRGRWRGRSGGGRGRCQAGFRRRQRPRREEPLDCDRCPRTTCTTERVVHTVNGDTAFVFAADVSVRTAADRLRGSARKRTPPDRSRGLVARIVRVDLGAPHRRGRKAVDDSRIRIRRLEPAAAPGRRGRTGAQVLAERQRHGEPDGARHARAPRCDGSPARQPNVQAAATEPIAAHQGTDASESSPDRRAPGAADAPVGPPQLVRDGRSCECRTTASGTNARR